MKGRLSDSWSLLRLSLSTLVCVFSCVCQATTKEQLVHFLRAKQNCYLAVGFEYKDSGLHKKLTSDPYYALNSIGLRSLGICIRNDAAAPGQLATCGTAAVLCIYDGVTQPNTIDERRGCAVGYYFFKQPDQQKQYDPPLAMSEGKCNRESVLKLASTPRGEAWDKKQQQPRKIHVTDLIRQFALQHGLFEEVHVYQGRAVTEPFSNETVGVALEVFEDSFKVAKDLGIDFK